MHISARKGMLAFPFYETTLTARKPQDPAYPAQLETVGDHLRKRRLDLNLLQKVVARQIGAHITSLWAWETNTKTPALRYYPAILKFLGYDPWQGEDESFAQKIKKYRYRNGLSQVQLASMLKVDPRTVSDWEAGRKQPSKVNRNRLEDLLIML